MASKRLKILVVDDDPTSLEVLETVLTDLGHAVLTRESALGTSVEILRERPDVVLLDVNMPALSGDKLLRVIRDGSLAHHDWQPLFIFVSGNDPESLELLVKENGALGAIEKRGGPEGIARDFRRLMASSPGSQDAGSRPPLDPGD